MNPFARRDREHRVRGNHFLDNAAQTFSPGSIVPGRKMLVSPARQVLVGGKREANDPLFMSDGTCTLAGEEASEQLLLRGPSWDYKAARVLP